MTDSTPFSQQIAHLGKGTTDDELTQELAELVRDIKTHRAGGTITLELKLKPILAGHEVELIDIVPSIKVKKPKAQRLSTRMFATYDGDLLRNDPDQGDLDLKTVDTDTGEIKQL